MKNDNKPKTTKQKVADNIQDQEVLERTDFFFNLAKGLTETMFEGDVELVIPPPVDQALTLQIHRQLKSIPKIESIDIKVSEDKGIAINFFLREPTPLLKILFKQGYDISWESQDNIAVQQAEGKTSNNRLILTTKS
jgi:hypothetical protein